MESSLSKNLFYDLKLSTTKNYSVGTYTKTSDSNYVHDRYLENFGPGFFTGGQQKYHDERTVTSSNAKIDLNWIVNKNHNIKTGLNFTNYKIIMLGMRFEINILVLQKKQTYTSLTYWVIQPYMLTSTRLILSKCLPIQDKMEFDEMVINIGLRYDNFNPNSPVPSDQGN